MEVIYEKNVCDASPKDSRNYIHKGDMSGGLPPTHSIPYANVLHQRKVGVCTAMSLVQQANRHYGQKFSTDFQYYLQKTQFDGNWFEGSSLLSELTIAKKFGLLPIEHLPSIIDEFPNITYDEYVKVLHERIFHQLDELKAFASQHKIAGYASVKIDDTSIAQGIYTSSEGILTRFEVTKAWWTAPNGLVSWKYEDISPLKVYPPVVSGHAISATGYDFTTQKLVTLTNTWSKEWCKDGTAQTLLNYLRPTEAWVIYWDTVPPEVVPPTKPFSYTFTKNLKYLDNGYEVKQLQNALNRLGYMKENTGFYGNITVGALKKFQWSRGIFSDGKSFGPITRLALNFALK